MFDNISTIIKPFLPAAQVGCFIGAGALLGRKVIMGVGCAAIAKIMGNQNAAEWNERADKYLSQAKKDAFRDLTVAGLVGLGLTAGYFKEEEAISYKTYLKNFDKGLEDIPAPVKFGFDFLNLGVLFFSGPGSWKMPKLRIATTSYFIANISYRFFISKEIEKL